MVSTGSTVIVASTLAADAPAPTIGLGVFITLLTVLAGTILLAGVLIIVSRRGPRGPRSGGSRSGGSRSGGDRDASVVRSWIAVSLVIGLLVFVAATFTVDQADIRSALIGALAANVGAAIAFYFSSKSSDQARQDILDATFGIESVPVLVDTCVSDARALLGTTSFKLSLDGTPGDDWMIRTQDPHAHTSARRGSTIFVTTAAKTTDSSGQDGQAKVPPPRLGEVTPAPASPTATDQSAAPVVTPAADRSPEQAGGATTRVLTPPATTHRDPGDHQEDPQQTGG